MNKDDFLHTIYFIEGSREYAISEIHKLYPLAVDYHFMYDKFGISEAHEVRSFLNQTQNNNTVFYIQVKSILPDAQHALLKVLEDLTHCVFVLVIPNVNILIETLLSRGSVIKDNLKDDTEIITFVDIFLKSNAVERINLFEKKTKQVEDMRVFIRSCLQVLFNTIKNTDITYPQNIKTIQECEVFLQYNKISMKHIYEFLSLMIKK